MSNAELFKKVFGIYAEEFWAYPREKMLDWLTSDVPNLDVGDTISREVAIEAVLELDAKHRVSWKDAVIDMLDALPSAEPEYMHTVMLKIKEKYEKAMNTPCISNPMAWALYYTWKEYAR